MLLLLERRSSRTTSWAPRGCMSAENPSQSTAMFGKEQTHGPRVPAFGGAHERAVAVLSDAVHVDACSLGA